MTSKRTATSAIDLKKKKKKWVPILAGPEFNNQEIGETFIEETEQALGKTIQVNLVMLTKDPKRQNFNVYFKVNEIKNNIAMAKLTKYSMQVAQLKKITKKAKNKIDDSVIYQTKDNEKVVIKPIMITKNLTYKTSLKLLRKASREFLTNYVKANTAAQVMQDIINNVVQRDMRNYVKKVTPLAVCMVKTAELKQ